MSLVNNILGHLEMASCCYHFSRHHLRSTARFPHTCV
jgi:hypothetical protein